MMNHLGEASKAANSDDTSSSGNAAFAVPHRWRPEPRTARGGGIPRSSASQARTFEAFCQKIASISKRTNSPRPKGGARAISCNIC